jgi:DNA-binding SARP family transcriptional activator
VDIFSSFRVLLTPEANTTAVESRLHAGFSPVDGRLQADGAGGKRKWLVLRSTPPMEYRILGPLEVVDSGNAVPLGPGKQRALLALLLLDANRVVTVDRLVDGLWGDRPPERAVKALQTYVSRLRKMLPETTLRTRPRGYVIELDPDLLDLHRFERSVAVGRQALVEGQYASASAALGEALGLWRGRALAEFASEPFGETEGARLEELRLLALEERIEAELALGRHADLVAELEALVAEHALRERFRGQLMRALYGSGRQAEALAAYRDARTYFVEELGIEPSRSLHNLEAAILRQDSTLDRPTNGSTAVLEKVQRDGSEVGVFVGRVHETARLLAALDDALAGRGRLVVLAGEQGIGKTRMAMELGEEARRRGASVLWGRCYEREGAPPFWPWVQALRAYAATCDPALVRSQLHRQAALVAELVPELRDRVPELEPWTSPRDPAEARFQLFDAVATLLERAARVRPLLIVLDDLHASDAGSLLLLEFVARELAAARVLVVGTCRDAELGRGHPLVETLAELTRERLFERVAVRGLSEPEVRGFIEASVDLPLPPELAEAVHERTEGNPLFVTEVVRLLVHERSLVEAPVGGRDWSVRVPESVRDVIQRRLDRLSAQCNEILQLSAVVGREFGLEQLRVLVGNTSVDELLSLIDEACDAHAIEEVPEAVDRYRFAHGLIQETLVEELGTTRRVRLHARIAEALEALYGDDADAHAAELVHHFVEAQGVLDFRGLVHYSRVAGEQALAAHAYDDALAHFSRALDAKSGQAMDDETAWLLFGLARSEFGARERYDLGDAIGHVQAAFAHFLESGDERAAVEIASHPIPYVYGSPDAAALAARALELVSPTSLEAGHLLSTLGWFTGMTDYASAGEAFGRSRAIARSHADRALERKVLVSEAHVDFWHLEYRACLEKALRAIELAHADGDERTEMMARSEATRMCATLGDPDGAGAHAHRMAELAERFRERYWLVTARVNRLTLATLTGDWDEARSVSDEGLVLQERDARNLAARALVEAQVGEAARAEQYVERLLEARRLSAPGFPFEDACVAAYLPLVAGIVGVEAWLGPAREAAQAIRSYDVVVPMIDLYVTVGRGVDAVWRADPKEALAAHDALVQVQGTAPAVLGVTADRLLGLFSLAAGQPEAGVEHFERGLRFCKQARYRPEYAWMAADCADAMTDLGGADNLARAADLRAEALSLARDLRMQPLVDRLLSRHGP